MVSWEEEAGWEGSDGWACALVGGALLADPPEEKEREMIELNDVLE